MSQRFAIKILRKCPYPGCRERTILLRGSCEFSPIVRKGVYRREFDSKKISRYFCKCCKRSFSSSTGSKCFRQKKRKLNTPILRLLVSGVSQRRVAKYFGVNRKTVVRKFLHGAVQAKKWNQNALIQRLTKDGQFSHIQFDEMETFERSKCLPLSMPLVVEAKTRRILAFDVCQMPGKGHLAAISRKKYGFRKDHRRESILEVFRKLTPYLSPRVTIESDQKPMYPVWIKTHLPNGWHKAYKGRRGCIVGQGELKKIGFDPLFDLNHTCAMIRANINRLFRRTWCTTKRVDRLKAHLEIYVWFHNTQLIK